MSGFGEMGHEYAANVNAYQISQKDMDQYYIVQVQNPAISSSWFGAGTSTGTTVQPIVLASQYADWPRTAAYCFTGGTAGGTITANWLDQFGSPVTETVALGSVAGGGTTYGTAIVAKFVSGTVNPNTSTTGTYTIGYGTVGTSNWFGLLTKVGGTSDLVNIRWINNGTPTVLNKGTALGTLIDTTRHAFQGTSGIALTDVYDVILTPTFNNVGKGTMCAL